MEAKHALVSLNKCNEEFSKSWTAELKGRRKIMGSPLMPESRVINRFHATRYAACFSHLAAKF
jgi:hypothetical protein